MGMHILHIFWGGYLDIVSLFAHICLFIGIRFCSEFCRLFMPLERQLFAEYKFGTCVSRSFFVSLQAKSRNGKNAV